MTYSSKYVKFSSLLRSHDCPLRFLFFIFSLFNKWLSYSLHFLHYSYSVYQFNRTPSEAPHISYYSQITNRECAFDIWKELSDTNAVYASRTHFDGKVPVCISLIPFSVSLHSFCRFFVLIFSISAMFALYQRIYQETGWLVFSGLILFYQYLSNSQSVYLSTHLSIYLLHCR